MVSQAVASSGAMPSTAAGNNNNTVAANRSFGRLISTSRVPKIETSDLCLVLAVSSPASPQRGSTSGSRSGAASSPVSRNTVFLTSAPRCRVDPLMTLFICALTRTVRRTRA